MSRHRDSSVISRLSLAASQDRRFHDILLLLILQDVSYLLSVLCLISLSQDFQFYDIKRLTALFEKENAYEAWRTAQAEKEKALRAQVRFLFILQPLLLLLFLF